MQDTFEKAVDFGVTTEETTQALTASMQTESFCEHFIRALGLDDVDDVLDQLTSDGRVIDLSLTNGQQFRIVVQPN